jgi:adenosylcobinamide-GDP ribazoletransferase
MTSPLPLRSARAAFSFLTRIPVGGDPYSEMEWRWASGWFPVVGAAIGMGMAFGYLLLMPAGSVTAALGALALGMVLTGAFHEDGLADSADALGGAATRPRLFEILKDSRIGTYGAAALVISIALRASLLSRLGTEAPLALILSQTISRCPPVWLMGLLPYVTAEAQARSKPVMRAGWPQAVLATIWAAAMVVVASGAGLLEPMRALALVPAMGLIAAILASWFRARAGGITGDFLGATQQLCEILSLLIFAWGSGAE